MSAVPPPRVFASGYVCWCGMKFFLLRSYEHHYRTYHDE